jgi:acyl-coenzyme A synthetase/AMP-(fatty) acid ligase
LIREASLSPAPILEAVQGYRGSIIDVDAQRVWGPDEFAAFRETLAARLRQAGLRPGGRVLVALPNGPLFVAALAAILACEGSPLLVHHKAPAAELLRYAQRFCADFVACEPDETALPADLLAQTTEIVVGDTALRWAELRPTARTGLGPLLRGVPLHPTSGSTGLPKVAIRPGFAAMEEARHYAATLSIDAGDAILAVPPMSHAYGYGMCVMVPLLTGANIVSLRSFSITAVRRALELHRVTVFPAAPAMLAVLSFSGRMDLRDVRWVLTAGATLTRRTAEHFHETTGAHCCPLYGTTETGGITIATAAEGRDLDGRVGPPMEGVSVRVRQQPDAPPVAPDVGKLHVRSSSMMTGYLDDQGQVSVPLDEGWFGTGDLARIADDGTIHLRGRDSEVINVAGLKVTPCEVEEVIGQMPGVREVKVYGGTHRSGTDVVKAAVALEQGVTAADVRAHCQRQLVYFKRPQTVTVVDALPRNAAGKIMRDALP